MYGCMEAKSWGIISAAWRQTIQGRNSIMPRLVETSLVSGKYFTQTGDRQPEYVMYPECFFQGIYGNNGVHGGVNGLTNVYKNAQYENMF